VPDAPTPPAKPTAGSNAGKLGTAEQATVQTACFVAGTPIRLSYGCKRIEQIRKGDRVLSRDQYNPSAPVVEQVVEETFIRTAPVIRLRVCGQELRPTGGHPFYVPGRGWVLAWSLRLGDVLHTLEGEAVRVERVEDKGEVERVYNFRVRELQTYFVGDEVWGFAIWSHNTNGHQAGSNTSLTQAQQRAISRINNTIRDHLINEDISGALRDLIGNPVPKRQGGFYNHAKEVNDSITGLRKQLKILEGIDTPEAQMARQVAQDAISKVVSALSGAGI
jgi:hypothetical protein